MPQLSKAQQYVAGKHAIDTLWNEMTDAERAEAKAGIDWLEFISVATGGSGKRRGRPVGSKTGAKSGAGKLTEETNATSSG